MKQNNGKQTKWLVGCGVTIALMSFIAGTRADEIMAVVAPWFGVRHSADRVQTAQLQETYRQLKNHYDGALDEQELLNGAQRGLVEAAGDPHTTFLDPKEVAEFEKSLRGDIGGGIGAEIGLRHERLTIVRPLKGSPAEQAGIRAGDVIVGVNDEVVLDWTVEQVVAKIRGEIGTSVRLSLKRGAETKQISVRREQVVAPTVERSVEHGVGILRVQRFNDETGALARSAADYFRQQGVRRVVLDLRGNPGGTVTAAQALAGLWLDKQPIMTERRGDRVIKTVYATGQPVLGDVQTIVLIDGGSASASEIVAGALRDHGKATLMGEKSYGKGSVQKLVPLSGGAQLKVTEARWFTPRGITIDKKGIEPDIKVELTAEDLNEGRDPQLERARQ